MSRLLILTMIASATAALADPPDARVAPDPRGCAEILTDLRASVGEDLRAPLRLTAPPSLDGEGCDATGFDALREALRGRKSKAIDLGRLDGHPTGVWSDGPSGSGHYWALDIAVVVRGTLFGACTLTSTAGWRNIPADGVRVFGYWQRFRRGRLVVWSGLALDSVADSLLYPTVYRLKGHALVVDERATRREIARFGQRYARIARLRDDRFAHLHREAAAAYAAFSAGAACRTARPR